MAEITKTNLLTSINTDLADNNAGLISAEDVRSNIYDTADSINAIVCSGDTDGQYPFYNNVRLKKIGTVGGKLFAESGIRFPNAPNNPNDLQIEPFLGVAGLQHDSLGGLPGADPHTQYLRVDSSYGHRAMSTNLKLGNNWIGPSGYNNDGFKFVYSPTGTTILTSGTIKFDDGSTFKSAIGVAKAFANFDGTLTAINYGYNVYSITKIGGVSKFNIELNSGVVGSGYTVIAHSNARNTNNSLEDFDRHTTCSVVRSGINPTTGRVLFTLGILNENGNYADSKVVDFVVFGSGVN